MMKAIVAGAGGRMGGRIIHIIQETEGIELAGATESSGSKFIGRDSGEVAGTGSNSVIISDDISTTIAKGDVLIDFTLPAATMENLSAADRANKGMVIGTTGLSPEQTEKLGKISENIKIVYAPNMSVGINVMLKVLADITRILGDDYDMEVIEAHHRLKKDAPSGTALKIAEVLADAAGRNIDKVGIYTRKGLIGERTKKEIGIQTIRAGDIVGEHTVIFGGIGERLEVTHRATNRDNFARGAVRAALWLADKEQGLFDMHDVLGLKP